MQKQVYLQNGDPQGSRDCVNFNTNKKVQGLVGTAPPLFEKRKRDT